MNKLHFPVSRLKLLISILLIVGGSAVIPQTRPLKSIDTTVSLNFKDARIIDILRLLSVQNNLNIIAGEDVKGEVTVSLNDVGLGTALDAILKVNGYDWFMQENIIVIKPADQEMSGELTTRIYKLNYVDASAMSVALSNVLTDKGKVQIFSPILFTSGAGTGRGGAGTGATGAGQALPGALSGGQSGAGNVGGGQGGGGLSATHLLVTDLLSNFTHIEEVITNLDKQIAQINIAVKFIESKLSTEEKLGINWDMRASLIAPSAAAGTEGLSIGNLGKWSSLKIATLSVPLFTALMEILSSDDDTRLLQEPQVTTMDNTIANVSIGTTIPILVPQTEGGLIGTQPVTYEDQEITITLTVQPRINEDRFISMNVQASVQALVGYTPGGERPIVSERSTSTQVMVSNGETLLIGGLIFEQKIESEDRVPVLGNLPLIKRLFSQKTTISEQRELLIFITSNIVKLS